MSTIIISLAVLTLAILTPYTDADCTTLKNGVPNFSLKTLCGKKYYVGYMSGISADCIISKISCDSGDDINVQTKIIKDGKSSTESSVLKDEGNGVVSREFKDNGVVRKEYVLSYTESEDGNFKMSFVICAEGNAKPTKKGIVSSSKSADYTDELAKINEQFPDDELKKMENTCDFD